MSLFLISFVLVLLSWWMLSTKARALAYREWIAKPTTTLDHLKSLLPHIFSQFSVQNLVAQGFVDGELKLLNQRRSFMLVSFSRLGVLLAGLVLVGVLNLEIFLGLLVLGTLLLIFFFKKPVMGIQLAFLAGVFYFVYQWSFFQGTQWVFGPKTSSLVYILTDASLNVILGLFTVSIIATVLLRIEYWSLWFSSLLFFVGGLAHLNVLPFILGEAVGWSLFWMWQSRGTSKQNRVLQRESFAITLVVSVIFIFIMAELKSMGFFNFRVMGPLVDKKIIFIATWAFWEIFLSLGLMLWGHFRAQSEITESTDIEPIRIPLNAVGRGLLKYPGWLPEQIDYRRQEIQRRLESLDRMKKEIGQDMPLNLAQKSILEVESLKALLGALK